MGKGYVPTLLLAAAVSVTAVGGCATKNGAAGRPSETGGQFASEPSDDESGALAAQPDPMAEKVESLRAKAEEAGRLRVIVMLSMPSGEGDNERADSPEPEEIERRQQALIDAMPEHELMMSKPLPGLPMVVMEVTAAGLERLLASDLVEAIDEDALARPQ